MKSIKNNLCSIVPGTNEDVYTGTFSKDNDLCVEEKFLYTISFVAGTQARGHEVASLVIYRLWSDGCMSKADLTPAEHNALEKEILKGF